VVSGNIGEKLGSRKLGYPSFDEMKWRIGLLGIPVKFNFTVCPKPSQNKSRLTPQEHLMQILTLM
jgi:hypothetical protein